MDVDVVVVERGIGEEAVPEGGEVEVGVGEEEEGDFRAEGDGDLARRQDPRSEEEEEEWWREEED